MAVFEISSKEKWEKAHRFLDLSLKKEVVFLREILANLHQEELALMEKDHRRWRKIMEERSEIVMQLRQLRLKRLQTTLPLGSHDEANVGILTKLDQLIALIDRINLQNCRNDALFDQMKHKKDLPLTCPYPHPLRKPKRKTALATYPRKH